MELNVIKRASNFSPDEETLLIALVEKYKAVVECKKSNVTTWKDKEKIWLKIQNEFNCSSGTTFRSAKHLKEKYSNLKKKAKRKFAEEKTEINKTGGGAFTPVLVSDVDIAIRNILGSQMEGLKAKCDSDSTVCTPLARRSLLASTSLERGHNYDTGPKPCAGSGILDPRVDPRASVEKGVVGSDTVEIENVMENLEAEKVDDADQEVGYGWSSYSSKNLKRPKSRKLLATRCPATSKKNGSSSVLVEEKLNFLRLQKEKFLEEHKIKMEILELEKEINLGKLYNLNRSSNN